MGSVSHALMPSPDPLSATTTYSRPSPFSAAADAIPILVGSTYHVFHLTTPPHTVHHPPRLRSTWSRLRSTDLTTWARDGDPVLHPSEDASAPDADGAWTGAAVHGPDGGMKIFYTGYNLSQGGKQTILRAVSSDPHGTAFDRGVPIDIQGDMGRFEDIDFRDPYVFFNEASKEYWMLVATRLSSGPHWTRGCIALLTSPDLTTWTISPKPLFAPNDIFCPECPELFPLSGRWYLVYSRFHGPDAGTVYRVSETGPSGPFRAPRNGSRGRLDGRRWYAAKSCPKAGRPDRRVYFGWTGDYVDEEAKWLWGGDLGSPREVSADEGGNLRVSVPDEVKASWLLASTPVPNSIVAPSLCLACIDSTATTFPDVSSGDLLLSFRIKGCDSLSFGTILQQDATEKGFKIQFSPSWPGRYTVCLMTDFPPLDDFWADQYDVHLPRPVDGPELVRHESVLVDDVTLVLRGQLVEVFCGGRSISYRLPRPGGKTRRLGWFVQDGMVELGQVSARCLSAE